MKTFSEIGVVKFRYASSRCRFSKAEQQIDYFESNAVQCGLKTFSETAQSKTCLLKTRFRSKMFTMFTTIRRSNRLVKSIFLTLWRGLFENCRLSYSTQIQNWGIAIHL